MQAFCVRIEEPLSARCCTRTTSVCTPGRLEAEKFVKNPAAAASWLGGCGAPCAGVKALEASPAIGNSAN